MSLFEDNVYFKPFKFPWANEIWKRHESMHWVEDEVPMGDDVAAWKSGKMTEVEKDFVTQILRMFTQSDVNVGNFYYKNLIPTIKNNEVTKMLGGFANREGTHQNAYSLLNETLGLPEGDYKAFLEYKEMSDKHDFMMQADPSTKTGFGLALAKGVFNEGVSLFASFVMLLNFQRRGLMMGMCKIVAWSILDESVHVEGVSQLFRAYCAEHPRIVNSNFKKAIYDMARTIVELEDAFIELAYAHGDIEGLDKDEVKQYIRYIADRRLVQLGLKENFNIEKNPLPWLDWIVNGTKHTNFFESKVVDYEVAGLQGEWSYEDDQKVVVYWREECPWCVKAKTLLTDEGISFEAIDLTNYEKRQEFYREHELSGPNATVPQIFINGERIGGYTQLVSYLNDRT